MLIHSHITCARFEQTTKAELVLVTETVWPMSLKYKKTFVHLGLKTMIYYFS